MSHTPTPWKYDGHSYIWGPKMEMIADDNTPVIRMRGVGAQLPIDSNAEFIVKACNENEELHSRISALEAENARLKEENESNFNLAVIRGELLDKEYEKRRLLLAVAEAASVVRHNVMGPHADMLWDAVDAAQKGGAML